VKSIDPYFATAAGLALIAFATHLIVGGRYAVRPLLAATDITHASRWLNYLCWHMATVLLFLMTIFLGLAAAGTDMRDSVVLIAAMSASTSILSASIAIHAGINPLRFPATYLLAGVATFAVLGLTE
jgi:hypothetical protein